MKPANFGKAYGIGEENLWKNLLSLGYNWTFEKVKQLHRGWDTTFPKMAHYQKRCKQSYYNSTAPLTLLGGSNYITSIRGRIRRPEFSRDGKKKYLTFNQIINFPIQATCTDFLKTALVDLYFLIKNDSLPATVVLSAHDEIILECHKEDAKTVELIGANVMVSAAQRVLEPIMKDAPVEVDTGIGTSWDAKP